MLHISVSLTGWVSLQAQRWDGPLTSDFIDAARSLFIGLYGIGVLLVAIRAHGTVARWPMWLLPLVLSLDNFSYGVVNDVGTADGAQQPLTQAVVSGRWPWSASWSPGSSDSVTAG